jgi:hypothetical protein
MFFRGCSCLYRENDGGDAPLLLSFPAAGRGEGDELKFFFGFFLGFDFICIFTDINLLGNNEK